MYLRSHIFSQLNGVVWEAFSQIQDRVEVEAAEPKGVTWLGECTAWQVQLFCSRFHGDFDWWGQFPQNRWITHICVYMIYTYMYIDI